MKKIVIALVCIFFAGIINLGAHCQIPCGIYTDALRTAQMYEDMDTIEKAMTEVKRLSSSSKAEDKHQMIRWITVKEQHAQKIQDTVAEYFMTQRIKPVEEGGEGYDTYIVQITLLHSLLIDAMKSKQNLDESIPQGMRKTLKAFEKAYPPAALPEHDHSDEKK